MKATPLAIPDVILLEPKVFGGDRGFFFVSFENKCMLWIPEGFAQGFGVLSDTAEFLYKTADYWFPELERSIHGDDPDLAIDWMLQTSPALSGKDAQGKTLTEVECFA